MVLQTKSLVTGLWLLVLTTAAIAGPVGSYDVVGTNPDSGGEYRGTVTVSRTGETYKVVWDVGGSRYIGTGLGALVQNGRYTVGPAHRDDTSISIGYVSDRIFGQAFYFLQDDGSWRGVWTYGGSDRIASETWYPR